MYMVATVIATAGILLRFAHHGTYNVFNSSHRAHRIEMIKSTIKHLINAILLVTACFFVLKIGDVFSRLWLLTWSAVSAIALCGVRLIAASVRRECVRRGRLRKHLAIVSGGQLSRELAARIVAQCPDTDLVGLFDDSQLSNDEASVDSLRVEQLEKLEELLSSGRIDEVVIALPLAATEEILQLLHRFHPFAVTVSILEPEGYAQFQILERFRYGDVSIFRVMRRPLDEIAIAIKWLEDKVVAIACLLPLLPVMFFISVAVKLDSKGPILFRQKRLGAYNVQFDMFKFRTMYVEHADPLGQQLTRVGDPRITRVGRFLRRTSLDELPQLMNVLCGEMSIVGPRPHPLAANAAGVAYALAVDNYRIRHRVKPGMTGWAQVNGYRGETRTIEQIRRRVEHDLYYIQNWSLWLDLLILARTGLAVLSRTNAV
jgi:Undecaprenyl-phosphate glucose phosphotransferase